MEEKVTIKDLISSYNELETSDKRKELGREITEMTIVLKKILGDMSSMNLPNVSLEEFNNLYDGYSSESEYLTGLYEDILNFKELLGIYLSKTAIESYED